MSTALPPAAPVIVKAQIMHKGRDTELRRFAAPLTYDELSSIANHLWGSQTARLAIEYIDEEGDRVRMSSEPEWQECLRMHRAGLLAPAASVAGSVALRPGGGPGSLQLFISKLTGRKRQQQQQGSSSDDDAAAVSVRAPAEGAPQSHNPPEPLDEPAQPSASQPRRPTPPKASVAPPAAATPPPQHPALVPPAAPEPAPARPIAPPPAKSPKGVAIVGIHTEEDLHDFFALLNSLYCLVSAENAILTGDRTLSRLITLESEVDGVRTVRFDRSVLRTEVLREADNRVRNMDWVRGEAFIERALRVFSSEAHLYYDLAMCMAGSDGGTPRTEDVLNALDSAVTFGFEEFNFIESAPSLAKYRGGDRYQDLVRRMKDSKGLKVVQSLLAVLPHLTIDQAKGYLTHTKGNVDAAINLALGGA